MQKKSLLTLSLAAVALAMASCAQRAPTPSTSSAPADSSAASSGAYGDDSTPVVDPSTPAGDDSRPAGDPSAPAGDDSTPSGGDSTPAEGSSAATMDGWTADEAALMKQYLNDYVAPYYELEDLDVSYDVDYECVAITGYLEADDIADIVDLYAAEGFALEVDDDAAPTEMYGDLYDEYYNDIYVEAWIEEGYVEIDLSFYSSYPFFPSDYILSSADYTGVEYIPEFTADYYQAYIGSLMDLFYYTVVQGFGPSVTEQTLLDYTDTLTKDSWRVEEDAQYGGIYADKNGVELYYYLDEGVFTVQAMYIGEDEDDSGEDASLGDLEDNSGWTDIERVDNTLTFDFSTTDSLYNYADDYALWYGGYVGFQVYQNDSATTVGNVNYYANPLRLYSGQAIVVSTTDHTAISSIEFTVNTTNSKSTTTKLATSTATVGEFSVEGKVVTLSGINAEQCGIVLDGDGKQVHLDKVVITFAE